MIPVGLGIGATHDECRVWSPTRAAGKPPIRTVAEPLMIMPGPAGMQPGNMQGIVIDVMVAAGIPPIKTVGAPGGMIMSGRPGWGMGVGVGAGGWIGAWQCGMLCKTRSVTRAAGGISVAVPLTASTRVLRAAVIAAGVSYFASSVPFPHARGAVLGGS